MLPHKSNGSVSVCVRACVCVCVRAFVRSFVFAFEYYLEYHNIEIPDRWLVQNLGGIQNLFDVSAWPAGRMLCTQSWAKECEPEPHRQYALIITQQMNLSSCLDEFSADLLSPIIHGMLFILHH